MEHDICQLSNCTKFKPCFCDICQTVFLHFSNLRFVCAVLFGMVLLYPIICTLSTVFLTFYLLHNKKNVFSVLCCIKCTKKGGKIYSLLYLFGFLYRFLYRKYTLIYINRYYNYNTI